ncbi:putative disease resistance protein RGA3 [Eucalyptus grandis]|uniref:putative disease resistance protein RGA3 n=1 Tax=Eucalyptus grandis TaxID=71139 RepID=UPI00192EAB48|nr:putative disease resistance protein RGA3 [Eucalyptus grandis]
MAEAVLFNLATEILKLAGSNTFSEIQLVRGARHELDSLKDTVKTIRAVLLDAEKQQWHNHQVKLWLERLRDVLYDVHELLDDVATEDLRRKVIPGNKISKVVRVFFSKSNQLAHHLKVANEIQKLRKRLDRIANDKKFHLEQHLIEETMAIVRGKKLEISTPDEQIIGRKKDKEKIKQLLFDSSSSDSVSFVSIVGKGGLGKTALSRLVYNDGEVEKHFDLKMWVCVSDVFDVNLIIKEILKSANYQDHENKPLDQLELQRLLRETLGKEKYLLVLDDIWNEDRLKWLVLGDWLKGGEWGSKILVTTRSHTVAKVTNENSAIYDLEGLTTDKSWDLFREVAFGERQASVDQRLEEMGRDIVRKCARVPLAIRTIGSLLYGKKEDQWNRYRVKELPEIPEIDAVDNGIMQVLKFSYDHLPSCLKHCFAYCSLFPKDHIYKKETMMPLWVAQGFIESRNGEDNLEEVADNYLSKLICRSFLDAIRKDDNGEVLLFKMHDLMHDLAQKVAGVECKIVNFKGGDNDGRIRHVSFISKIFSEEKLLSLLKTSKLRTFLYLKGESSIFNSPKVFSKCRHCRALGLCKMDIPLPPSSFGKLKQLRLLYIFTNQSIEILPDSITDLVNLQFLKLFRCENLKIFPRDLRKLVNLRHLSIQMCFSLSHLPPLSELPSLRTLSLMGLHALKFIQQTSDPEQSNTICPFFPSLESLVLFNCKGLIGWWEKRQVMEAYQKHMLDNPQSSFPKLRSVEIKRCPDLNFEPPFPQVECLKIDSTKMLEKQLLTNSNCLSEPVVGSTFIRFSKLKHLDLSDRDLVSSILETLLLLASNLESMRLHGWNQWGLSGAMEDLSSLPIRRCEGLDLSCQEDDQGIEWQFLTKLRVLKISCIDWVTLPEWIRHVMTLQSLEISECKKLRSLPEWIGNFSLLKKLVLFNCPRLEHLPSEVHNLTCLKELRIINCPNLEGSCLTDVHVPVFIPEGI